MCVFKHVSMLAISLHALLTFVVACLTVKMLPGVVTDVVSDNEAQTIPYASVIT